MRHELPSGGWIELSEPSKVTERQRRPIRIAFASLSEPLRTFLASNGSKSVDPDDPVAVAAHTAETSAAFTKDSHDLVVMYEINDHIAACLTSAASFLAPGQVCTVDDITGQPGSDYDTILAVAAPYLDAFAGGVDFDPKPGADPSPTNPSSA